MIKTAALTAITLIALTGCATGGEVAAGLPTQITDRQTLDNSRTGLGLPQAGIDFEPGVYRPIDPITSSLCSITVYGKVNDPNPSASQTFYLLVDSNEVFTISSSGVEQRVPRAEANLQPEIAVPNGAEVGKSGCGDLERVR